MEIDKSKILKIKVDSLNERMQYHAFCDNNQPISIDYISPLGDNMGYTSLELLLISLASCVCSTVGLLLRKNGKTIKSIHATALGHRKKEHPTCFNKIDIDLNLISNDLKPDDVNSIIEIAKGIAPVWYMLMQSTEIKTIVNIEKF